MKADDVFIEYLSLMANINDTLMIVPGKLQKSVTPSEDIIVEAEFSESFPDIDMIAIGKLSDLVSKLKRLTEPDIQIDPDKFVLVDNNTTLVYKLQNVGLYNDPEIFVTPYNKDAYIEPFRVRDTYFRFLIEQKDIAKYLSFATNLPLTKIYVGEDNKARFKGIDKNIREEDTNTVEIIVSNCEDNYTGKCVYISTASLKKLAKLDFAVTVDGEDSPNFVEFFNKNAGIRYTLTPEDEI